jgi:outer membrane protein OmpA-like peptidoglycan-associated protein
MNATNGLPTRRNLTLLATAIAASVAAGCATTPVSPAGSAQVRQKLEQLVTDPGLASRAPVALQEAASAVRLAEQPLADDPALGAHRVYMADRKVEIARARAETRAAEDQRATLGEERESARLAARTREADATRADAEAASRQAATEAAELQRQIATLKAEATERGLVLTLGDVLFATGQSTLQGGATTSLDQLVTFLKRYPNRSITIEGHTDNVGSDVTNQGLSERRASAVRDYLVRQGIGVSRLSSMGLGESQPVADNGTSYGRQQNRRVVMIISEPVRTAEAAVL